MDFDLTLTLARSPRSNVVKRPDHLGATSVLATSDICKLQELCLDAVLTSLT
jgi:hypothetical protein